MARVTERQRMLDLVRKEIDDDARYEICGRLIVRAGQLEDRARAFRRLADTLEAKPSLGVLLAARLSLEDASNE